MKELSGGLIVLARLHQLIPNRLSTDVKKERHIGALFLLDKFDYQLTARNKEPVLSRLPSEAMPSLTS